MWTQVFKPGSEEKGRGKAGDLEGHEAGKVRLLRREPQELEYYIAWRQQRGGNARSGDGVSWRGELLERQRD